MVNYIGDQRIREDWDRCDDCGEMIGACICEYLPHEGYDYAADICGGDFDLAPLEEVHLEDEIPAECWAAYLDDREQYLI